MNGKEEYSFPANSAGPFGNDIIGPWISSENFFHLLAHKGLGWKDIHCSSIDIAEKNESYVIWKIGKKKMDELLFIRNGELVTYFSFHRKSNNGKIMWHFGDAAAADLIVQDILNIQNRKIQKRKKNMTNNLICSHDFGASIPCAAGSR